jgi:predicted glycoside hydrolase/deacetylase ChbG (UPF0249 family)
MSKIKCFTILLLLSCSVFQLDAQIENPPRLIVRGDDMGFTQSANEALLRASLEGIQTCIEIMPNTPWFPQAVSMLKKHPDIDIGIHLTLTSEWENLKWGPLTNSPSLVDTNGYFYPFLWPNKDYPNQHLREKPWKIEEVEKEFRAQIERVLDHLPWASHLSAHMGCTSLSAEVHTLSEELAKEYNLTIDLKTHEVENVRYKGPSKTAREKTESFIAMLRTLETGKTYLFVDHPALDTPELQNIYHIGYHDVAEDRQGVTSTWTSPEVKQAIQNLGIKLISYRDLND